MNVIAICSLLGESPEANSITRRFRDEPVLRHTVRRLRRVTGLETIVVLHWADQRADCVLIDDVSLFDAGPRAAEPLLASIEAAQRWADGWRGGLLGTATCDRGFSASCITRCIAEHSADAALLVVPSAGLIDPAELEKLLAAAKGERDFYFNHVPPGLGAVVVKPRLLQQCMASRTHPGRLLHYLPEAPILDPVLSDACVPAPLSVSRATGSFLLNSDRQIEHIEQATRSLNGMLMTSGAETIIRNAGVAECAGLWPRDLTIELSPRRHTRPVYAPQAGGAIERPELSLDLLAVIAREARRCDDLRVTLAGVGDPLCHSQFATAIALLADVHAVHVETDLLELTEPALSALTSGAVDVISIHLPAMRPATYAAVMGVDAMAKVLSNLERLLRARAAAGRTLPILVPTLTKTVQNFDELEAWYDTWLKALGSAVILGPSTYCGRIGASAVADMTPPLRRPCRRIERRMTLLSDGRFVACEQDVLGQLELGAASTAANDSIAKAWQSAAGLRAAHRRGHGLPILCEGCQEWHRA